jgi:putative hemolysin
VQLLLELLLVAMLLGIGLRLSAFFSGGETGFYRLSLPRVSIDAQAGDPIARRLLWYTRHPARFVATTLVGNNLANYLVTFAISMGVMTVFGRVTELLEVASTLLLAPLIFLFGELLPKILYYRAPLYLLRRDAKLFGMFYYLFLPLSIPLVWMTRMLERFDPQAGPRANLLLGRSRLVQLLSQGGREGVLTDVQSRLASGVLQIAPQSITDSVIPSDRVLGVEETTSRDDLLKFARSYGTSVVCLRHAGSEDGWFAYLRVMDLVLDSRPVAALVTPMPVIPASATKLDALQRLQVEGALQGVVVRGDQTIGVVSTRGLVEQLFRPTLVPTG